MDSFENGPTNTGQQIHLACRGLFLLSWLNYGELSIISDFALIFGVFMLYFFQRYESSEKLGNLAMQMGFLNV